MKIIFPVLLLVLLASPGCRHASGSAESAHDNRGHGSPAKAPARPSAAELAGMAEIPGGSFLMGSRSGSPAEKPAHNVTVSPFWIDRHEVTVADFARFVAATGYTTEAEKFGQSAVFEMETGEWRMVNGANWREPEGPGSVASPDEPVTQVSWNDAMSYAGWAGKRLPSEAEWEYAARGGAGESTYAWGEQLAPHGAHLANIWQGTFPSMNTGADGFLGRAPVGSFPKSSFGLFDMAGNVWEWCGDWFEEGYYATAAAHPKASDPKGPDGGEERVIRGGSWMCSENYCQGYRVAARSHATPDSAMNNLGFRCVR